MIKYTYIGKQHIYKIQLFDISLFILIANLLINRAQSNAIKTFYYLVRYSYAI